MIFKSICLAAALLAATTNAVVPSRNSTQVEQRTDEPKRMLGAVDYGAYQRRGLALCECQPREFGDVYEKSSAFVLLKRDGAENYGHVAGCFEFKGGCDHELDRGFVCFSTDNPDGESTTSEGWEGKGFWHEEVPNRDAVLNLFKGIGYTDWKRLDVYNGDPDRAMSRMKTVAGMPYNIVWRNCQNDVYDVLHDENSGYGITANSVSRNNGCYIGGVQDIVPGPNNWFDNKIQATASGVWKSDERGDDQCWGDKYCVSGKVCLNGKCRALGKVNDQCSGDNDCVSGLTCCGGKCKNKVNKRWCVGWINWPCFDNWTCP